MKRTRRTKPKKHIDIGVEGVEATVTTDEQDRVLIKLLGGLTLFHDVDDICLYVDGKRVTRPERAPGNPGTHLLGELYSRQPGVLSLQFRKHNGVFIHVDVGDQDLINNLRNLATKMLARATTFAKSTSNP